MAQFSQRKKIFFYVQVFFPLLTKICEFQWKESAPVDHELDDKNSFLF